MKHQVSLGDTIGTQDLPDPPVRKQIKGYRNLSDAETGAVNECKAVASDVGILCDRIDAMAGVDRRWTAIGRTTLQQGFMALIRGIAKPETF